MRLTVRPPRSELAGVAVFAGAGMVVLAIELPMLADMVWQQMQNRFVWGDNWKVAVSFLFLGLVVAVSGGMLLAYPEQVTFESDQRARLLRIERRRGKKTTGRTFPYHDILAIRVERLGGDDGLELHKVVVMANDGKPFETGARFDRPENANALMRRLAAEISGPVGDGGQRHRVAISLADLPRRHKVRIMFYAVFFGGLFILTLIMSLVGIFGMRGSLKIFPLGLLTLTTLGFYAQLASTVPASLRRRFYGDVDGPVQLQWDSDRRMVEVRRRRVYGMETWHFTGKEISEIVVEREDSPEQSASCVVRIVTHEIRTGPDLRETLSNPVERREETVLRSADPDEARATARRLAIEIGCPIRDET